MTALTLRVPARIGAKTQRAARLPSKRISLRQAQNMMDALKFAREIGTPLNAHATIHWVGTKAGDDPDGRLFAKLREKLLMRQGIPGGLTAIWVRERLSGGSAEVVTATCFSTWRTPYFEAGGKIRSGVHLSGSLIAMAMETMATTR